MTHMSDILNCANCASGPHAAAGTADLATARDPSPVEPVLAAPVADHHEGWLRFALDIQYVLDNVKICPVLLLASRRSSALID